MRRRARLVHRSGVLAVMAGLVATVAAGLAAAPALNARLPSAGELLEACRRSLAPQLQPGSLAALAFAGVAITVAARAAAAVVAELRLSRSIRPLLATGEARVCDGHDVLVVTGIKLQAFVAGLIRPQIFVSQGALAALDQQALTAVVAHEAYHRRCRDPLRLAAGRVAVRALFFLPGLRNLIGRYRADAELAADEAAVAATSRAAVARGLALFTAADDGELHAHPDRVDHLLGEPLPRSRWAASTALSVAIATALGVAGAETAETGAVRSQHLLLVMAQLCTFAAAGLALTIAVTAAKAHTRTTRIATPGERPVAT